MDTKQLFYQFLISSGILGLIGAAVGASLKSLLNKVKESLKESHDVNEAMKYGLQALLRHELYEMHNEWCLRKKYAPLAVKEDFENMYKRYHALGVNGVMDGVFEEFMNLPVQGDDKDDVQG